MIMGFRTWVLQYWICINTVWSVYVQEWLHYSPNTSPSTNAITPSIPAPMHTIMQIVRGSHICKQQTGKKSKYDIFIDLILTFIFCVSIKREVL